MDFEQLQVIWNSQEGRALYVLDLDALHAIVKSKSRRIDRGINAMELGMMVVCVASALFLAYEPIVEGSDAHQLFGAGVLLAVALWVLRERLRRQKREQKFEPTLVGELDRALSQVDFHIQRVRTFHWWFITPAFAIMLVKFIATHGSKPAWSWFAMLAAFVVSVMLVRLELRCVHFKRKRDLESLRSKLLDGA